MQNDNILHSTLIASFIQEYASPLQTIIKPPSPHDAPLSCLYREGWSEPRRVSLPKSEDWMTELRRNPVRASASEFRHSHSSLPVERHLEIQRSPPLSIILGTHVHCASRYHDCWLTIAPLKTNLSTGTWSPSGDLADLHPSHFTPNVFFGDSGSRARLNRGSEQREFWVVLSFFTGHSSFALLSNSKKTYEKRKEKKYALGVGEWEKLNDMPLSECIISFWQTHDSCLVFVKSRKGRAMAAVNPGRSHLTC